MLAWAVLLLAIAVVVPGLRVIVIDGVKIAARPFVAILLAVTTLLAVVRTSGVAWFGYRRALHDPDVSRAVVGHSERWNFRMGGVSELRRLAVKDGRPYRRRRVRLERLHLPAAGRNDSRADRSHSRDAGQLRRPQTRVREHTNAVQGALCRSV